MKQVTLSKVSVVLLLLFFFSKMFAGEALFRDCDVKLLSPSSAQGLVYVNAYRSASAINYRTPSPAQTAQIKVNLMAESGDNSPYQCWVYAYPKPGYAVAGIVTKDDYLAGRKDNYITWLSKPIRSGEEIIVGRGDSSKDVCKEDPTTSSSYRFSAKTVVEYYAIFRPSIKEIVTVSTPGNLKDALSKTHNGENIDDIIIQGSINEQDILYLKELATNKNLIRIDLSKARISSIPDEAFRSCYRLYEIVLPSTGLKSIGNMAFMDCHSLKKIKIPASVTQKGYKLFDACHSIDFNL